MKYDRILYDLIEDLHITNNGYYGCNVYVHSNYGQFAFYTEYENIIDVIDNDVIPKILKLKKSYERKVKKWKN